MTKNTSAPIQPPGRRRSSFAWYATTERTAAARRGRDGTRPERVRRSRPDAAGLYPGPSSPGGVAATVDTNRTSQQAFRFINLPPFGAALSSVLVRYLPPELTTPILGRAPPTSHLAKGAHERFTSGV